MLQVLVLVEMIMVISLLRRQIERTALHLRLYQLLVEVEGVIQVVKLAANSVQQEQSVLPVMTVFLI
jgi:hypothetical protein